jgi:hypothetical protein
MTRRERLRIRKSKMKCREDVRRKTKIEKGKRLKLQDKDKLKNKELNKRLKRNSKKVKREITL